MCLCFSNPQPQLQTIDGSWAVWSWLKPALTSTGCGQGGFSLGCTGFVTILSLVLWIEIFFLLEIQRTD